MVAVDARSRADRQARIRELNDELRRFGRGGHVVVTAGIAAMLPRAQEVVVEAVRRFAAFTPDNDPHGEHDFGAVQVGGVRCYWKIDYYDRDLRFASPDPADPAVTIRVMTVMLAEEY